MAKAGKASKGFGSRTEQRTDKHQTRRSDGSLTRREKKRRQEKRRLRESGDKAELYKLALKDLARSGLGKSDFRLLQYEVLTPTETDDFVGEARPSYRIPYFDQRGRVIAYSRVRFLADRKNKMFAHKTGKTREGTHRYSQPFNSSPHVYMPPYFNWRKIAKDPSQKILITEGEKKAAAACKAGIPCFALGGVYAFKSKKRDQQLIPELEQIVWDGREVEICFDADVMMKAEVRQALHTLATTLSQRYKLAALRFVNLDAETAGPKTGLDDFIKEHGAEAFQDLGRQTHRTTEKIGLLNHRLCYVRKPAAYFDLDTQKYYKNFGHVRDAFMNEGEELVDGTRAIPIIDMWNKSAARHDVLDVQYLPGKAEKNEDILNLWKASPIQPVKGIPKRWLELVHYIMGKPEYANWFLKWLAYPLQHPGAKLFQACFVYGLQGIGKTFVVDPVMELIYGTGNYHRLSNSDVGSTFNEYVGNKQFIVTNEIYLPDFSDRRTAMGALKDMITREKVNVNEKFQPKVTYSDHCNYYLSSNHQEALLLEPSDRRFFVIRSPDEKLAQAEYTDLDKYVRSEQGAGTILHYLQNLELGDFVQKGAALETVWRDEVITSSRDPLEEFTERVIQDPEMLFMVAGQLPDLNLFRAEDVQKVFEMTYPKYRFNLTINRMARLLNDARLEKRAVRVNSGSPLTTLYCVLRRDKWESKNNKSWAEHYAKNSRQFGNRSRH